ncbi:LXG domain-containing protein [Lentibacillus sp. L22]|uniref:LXG domain-containing protein n=1 Tax=Lentibacillus TaxID=175304 RepID=UPI0022B11A72|nr:LXG domain-containing protein [Lentibacillus daqui]
MKTLDVASLQEGVTATLQEIENIQSKITEMQKGVRGMIDLEDHLKGKMGDSIRSFYEGIHEPFLIFLYQSLTHYSQALEKLQQAVYSYESNENGIVREDFMDNDVLNGLDKAEQVTSALVDEANGIMDRISDLISLPKLDMEEFDSMMQKGKRKVKNSLEQLYELDHEQTKSLSEVGKDLKLLNQYINEMSHNFASDYSITSFDALSALKLTTLPTILKEVYGEPVKEEEDPSLWTKIKDGAVAFGKGAVSTGKGAVLGSFDVGKDTLVGLGNTFMHPVKTGTALRNMIQHPKVTGKLLGQTIAESYKRDMINGDAQSRSHWVTYALGNAAVSVVGTKGAGTVTKTSVTTTKASVKTAATAASKSVKDADLSRFLPYTPQYQLAGGARVPYNVVDGKFLKDQLIWKAENLPGTEKHLNNLGKATVWGDIKITQPLYKGTKIPKSFELTVDGDKFWVHPNGTKHMVEYITKDEATHGMPINSQTLLSSFQNSVKTVNKNGIVYDELINVGDWELIFSKPRGDKLQPVIKHAVYRPNN